MILLQEEENTSATFKISDSVENLTDKLEGWLDGLILILPNLILAILVFLLFLLAAKYLGRLLRNVILSRIRQESIKSIAIRVIKSIVILIGFFIALGLLNLDKVLTSVLAGAGVIGLAIGLALQGTLNNTFSGVILSFLPRIELGDWVETNGFAGKVEDINLRSIVIRQADNNFVMIPNAKIIEEPFVNYSQTSRSRVIISCGVGYSSDLERVAQLTTETIDNLFKQNKNEDVEFFFQEFGDSSINFIVRFWTDIRNKKEVLAAQHRGIIAIKRAFDKEGINIPFPIRTIDFSNKLSLTPTNNDQ
ncbi:mechanosensitive ion channel family protein [Aquimarina intermedia]|uniref:Small conductance mechanosensitive channel n=1 Tax=Aquimarina intermedia TaxID=350814 RepID=A0A5S5BUW0_9FLAO|nr:mechanosensitive ion channel family protein [Aquimarina intermedia]TYP70002.1 small conductance mechanosensitive channel [Aquimarina intermedia]